MTYRPCWLCGLTISPEPQAAWDHAVVRVQRVGSKTTLDVHVHSFCWSIHTLVKERDGRADLATLQEQPCLSGCRPKEAQSE